MRVEIPGAEAEIDAARLALDRQARSARHDGRERLGATHAAEPRGQNPAAGKIAAIVPATHLHERLIRPLNDALGADIDPGAGRHLAVHHEPLLIQLMEMIPVRPMRHEVGVRNQNARRVLVRAEHANRLAGLDEQRLVGLELAQRRDNAIEALPVPRRPANAAVHHQLARFLGHFGIQIIHQHPERRFREPALRGNLGTAGGLDRSGVVNNRHNSSSLFNCPRGRMRCRIPECG